MTDQPKPIDLGQSENPFRAPSLPASSVDESSDAAAIRNQYLKHEASVKSIGTLYILGAILFTLGSVSMIVMAMADEAPNPGLFLGLGIFYLLLGLFQGVTAMGLRKLKSWSRISATVLSVISLLGVPLGTIIGLFFLYLLWGQKGQYIFTDHYRSVMAATPEIKYKSSVFVVILLIVLLLIIAIAIGASIFAA